MSVVSRASQVAGERLERLVFHTAFVVQDGASVNDNFPDDQTEAFAAAAAASPDDTVACPWEVFRDLFIQDAAPDVARSVWERLVPQPFAPWDEKLELAEFHRGELPRSYIAVSDIGRCPRRGGTRRCPRGWARSSLWRWAAARGHVHATRRAGGKARRGRERMSAKVLSLTPPEVLASVHDELAAELAPALARVGCPRPGRRGRPEHGGLPDRRLDPPAHAGRPRARSRRAVRGDLSADRGRAEHRRRPRRVAGDPGGQRAGGQRPGGGRVDRDGDPGAAQGRVAPHAGVLAGEWNMVQAARTGVFEVGDRTVGIVGFGAIGQGVAARLAGFELGRLVYADAVGAPPEVERRLGVERVELDELLSVSDAVTLHVPLLESTRGLIDARRLALLPRGAVLVNPARGAVVDEPALCDALASGRLKGAALDVFEREPLPPDDPLRRLDNVLLSPHLAGSTNEARERMIAITLRNLDGVLSRRRAVACGERGPRCPAPLLTHPPERIEV